MNEIIFQDTNTETTNGNYTNTKTVYFDFGHVPVQPLGWIRISPLTGTTPKLQDSNYFRYLLHDSNQHRPSDLEQNIRLLESYKNLPSDWNSNGAEPFENEIVEKAIRIIKRLENQPQVFPTARKSIQFEYEKDDGDYLEFEIFLDKVLTYDEVDGKEGDEQSIDELSIFNKVEKFHG